MADGRGFTLEFGGFTPTRAEVYARVGGDGTVFTLPVETYASLPSDKDAFRPARAQRAQGLPVQVGPDALRLSRQRGQQVRT